MKSALYVSGRIMLALETEGFGVPSIAIMTPSFPDLFGLLLPLGGENCVQFFLYLCTIIRSALNSADSCEGRRPSSKIVVLLKTCILQKSLWWLENPLFSK
jgi:hypothetical protein